MRKLLLNRLNLYAKESLIMLFLTILTLISSQKSEAQTFVHPGGLHTQADLDRMKAKVAAGAHPWIDDWNLLITDSKAQKTYNAAPTANMGDSRQRADADAHAAYLNAIRWYISGDTSYANCAVRIFNAWSAVVNQVPTGTDISGLGGIPVFDFALAGEILRIYPGWAPADFTRFKNMMLNYWYPLCDNFLANHNGSCISHYWTNWDACNIGAILTIGVLCDDTAKYNQAIDYFKNGAGNGSINNAVPYIHPGNLGQWQESGRDQEHAQLGVGFLGSVCQVAWNQGTDLFGYNNNRLLAGAEYVARTNLSLAVPYQTYNNCDNVNQNCLSINGLGRIDDRPVYELIYNHYAVVKGLSTPNVKKMAQLMRPEHGSIDHFGYGTLTFTLNETASPYPASPIAPAPTGLVATAGVSRVMLNWTAPEAATAQGYKISRSTSSGGPYTSIASWTANTLPQYIDKTVTNGTTYYYVVQANNQSGTSGNSAQVSATPVAGSTLPSSWSRTDIGTVATAGSATYASAGKNTFVISGSGKDIGGTTDSYSFAYTGVTGDFTITTHVADVSLASAGYKWGLVMRESLSANSPMLTVNLTGRQAQFGTRSTTGGATSWQYGNDYTWIPVWFRLQRTGNVFTGYQSSDGVNWFVVGSSTISMAGNYYAGLAVCAGTTTAGVLNTSYFDNTTVAVNLKVGAGDGKNILEWDPTYNSTYTVKRSTSAGGPYTTIANLTTTGFTDTNVSNGTTYYYVVASPDNIASSPEVMAVPNAGQATYLKFDETSGTQAIDSWGAAHGTLQATATRDAGRSGTALKLDGTSTSYATLPAGIVSTLNDFTVSAWVKMDTVTNWMRVFDFGSGTSKYMFLTVQAGTANVVRYAIKNGGSEQQVSFNYTLPLNTWTHFAVAQSGSTCTLYINGTAVASNTAVSIKPSTLGSTSLNYLGKSQFNDPMFKGSIDEFKIYSRALTAAEIGASSGQITYLKFDEASGTSAIDSWGTNNATLQATATRSTGLSGKALKLDGTSTSYATLPSGIVSALNDFTISTWVRMDAKSNWMRVFDFGSGTSKYMFLTIQAGTANLMRYAIKNGGSEQQVSFNYSLPLNTWTHFAVTQSGNTCTLYINGTAVATNTGVTITPSVIGATTQNYLGKSQYNDPIFNGSMDGFKIYSRALSAAEIQNFSNNQIAQKDRETLALDRASDKDVVNGTIIYPNPVLNNKFTITTKTELIGNDVTLKLIDLTGRTSYSKSLKNNTGYIEVVLNRALSAGVYSLILNNQYSGKVIIE